MNKGFCCEMMEYHSQNHCAVHGNVFECPDCLIYHGDKRYGIIIHDGGESYITINFCPWCGTSLIIDKI